jgi:hypothetical protein
MTIITALLLALATTLVFGGWTLLVGLSQAEEGYECDFGFVRGYLPALAPHLGTPQAKSAAIPAPPRAATTAGSSTDTSTQSVTIFVSRASRPPSPLYRRQHRSGASASPFAAESASPFPAGSAAPFPGDSASPFEVQCAAARARVSQTDGGSTPPIPPVSAKSAPSHGARA